MFEMIKNAFKISKPAILIGEIRKNHAERDIDRFIASETKANWDNQYFSENLLLKAIAYPLEFSRNVDNKPSQYLPPFEHSAWLIKQLTTRFANQGIHLDCNYLVGKIGDEFTGTFHTYHSRAQAFFMSAIIGELKLSLPGFDINKAEDQHGRNLLMLALYSSSVSLEAVDMLIKQGADVNYQGATCRPVHAVMAMNPDVFKKYQLLENHGADILIDERFDFYTGQMLLGINSTPLYCSTVREYLEAHIRLSKSDGMATANKQENLADCERALWFIDSLKMAKDALDQVDGSAVGARKKAVL